MSAFDGNASACASHYGFKYPTFVDVLRRNGIERLAPEDRRNVGAPRVEIPIEEAIKLSDQGVTYSTLAEKYGVTYGIVMRRMQEAGYSSPRDKNKKWIERTLPTSKWKLLQELKAEYGGCEICGHCVSLDLAHIHAGRHGGKLVKENTLLLCPNHHRAFDAGKLTRDEFLKIKERVRAAEKIFRFINNFYGEW
jgi:hypothetical protein